MNKRHYEHTLPNIRGSLSNTYGENIPMYLGKTSGCFDLSVLYSLGLSPGV